MGGDFGRISLAVNRHDHDAKVPICKRERRKAPHEQPDEVPVGQELLKDITKTHLIWDKILQYRQVIFLCTRLNSFNLVNKPF